MKEMIGLFPILLYFFVGIICLVMAKKTSCRKNFFLFTSRHPDET